MGSCSVLLGRPGWTPASTYKECVNDKDGFVSNFWRAVQADPEGVAHHCDWPEFENDLHARHSWLVRRAESMTAKLEGDPHWYNTRIAGWWAWGMACWIGNGFCSGKGPWRAVAMADGTTELQRNPEEDDKDGISRQLIHFGGDMGVKRRVIHLTSSHGVKASTPVLEWLTFLQKRFQRVRVACGDWSRVCTDSPTIHSGNVTAVLLDPPYGGESGRSETSIYRKEDLSIAGDVLKWCIERGPDPRFRIGLCGYDSEHNVLADAHGWDVFEWSGPTGYANQGETEAKKNRKKERIWFSPHCLAPKKKPSLGIFR